MKDIVYNPNVGLSNRWMDYFNSNLLVLYSSDMCGTSSGLRPDYRDRDRNQNIQLFNIQNSLTFQIKFFVHPKSNHYFHINIW